MNKERNMGRFTVVRVEGTVEKAALGVKELSGYSYVNPDHILSTLPATFLLADKPIRRDPGEVLNRMASYGLFGSVNCW